MPTAKPKARSLKKSVKWFFIQDERAVELLSDPVRRRYLRAFMGQTRSISQAARETKTELHVMRYFVEQMLMFKLLLEVGGQKRQGREMKLYRAVSTAFVANLPELEPEHLQMLFSTGDWHWRHDLFRGMVSQMHKPGTPWVARFYTSDGRDWITDVVPEQQKHLLQLNTVDLPSDLPIWYNNLVLKLELDAAKRLQSELAELYWRFEEESRRNYNLKTPQYTLQLGFAPMVKS